MRANRNKLKGLLNLSLKLVPALILSLAILSFAGGRVSAATASVVEVPVSPQSYTGAAGSSALPITVGDDIQPGGGDTAIYWNLDLPSTVCSTATITKLNISIEASNSSSGPGAHRWIMAVFDVGTTTIVPGTILNNSAYEPSDVPGTAARGGDSSASYFVPTDGRIDFTVDIANVGVADFENNYAFMIYFAHYSSITFSKSDINVTYDNSSCPQTSPPNTEPDTSSGSAGQTTTSNALTNDNDPDNDSLSITSVTIAGVGTFSVPTGGTTGDIDIPNVGKFSIKSNGEYSYTPLTTFSGNYPQITYTISDGTSTATGPIVISVAAVSTSTSTNSPASTNPTTSTNSTKASQKTLAKTGTNLSLILALAVTTSIAALSLRKFSKR